MKTQRLVANGLFDSGSTEFQSALSYIAIDLASAEGNMWQMLVSIDHDVSQFYVAPGIFYTSSKLQPNTTVNVKSSELGFEFETGLREREYSSYLRMQLTRGSSDVTVGTFGSTETTTKKFLISFGFDYRY